MLHETRSDEWPKEEVYDVWAELDWHWGEEMLELNMELLSAMRAGPGR